MKWIQQPGVSYLARVAWRGEDRQKRTTTAPEKDGGTASLNDRWKGTVAARLCLPLLVLERRLDIIPNFLQ